MKKTLLFVSIIALLFAGCSIIDDAVIDHSETVAYYDNGIVVDFDVTGYGSGFVFTDEGGHDVSVNDSADIIDFWYNYDAYDEGRFTTPDGDEAVYNTNDKAVKETRFAVLTYEEGEDPETDYMTAPSTITDEYIVIENDMWFWISLGDEEGRDTKYVKVHITDYSLDNDQVEFEYWIQTDGTRYFENEE